MNQPLQPQTNFDQAEFAQNNNARRANLRTSTRRGGNGEYQNHSEEQARYHDSDAHRSEYGNSLERESENPQQRRNTLKKAFKNDELLDSRLRQLKRNSTKIQTEGAQALKTDKFRGRGYQENNRRQKDSESSSESKKKTGRYIEDTQKDVDDSETNQKEAQKIQGTTRSGRTLQQQEKMLVKRNKADQKKQQYSKDDSEGPEQDRTISKRLSIGPKKFSSDEKRTVQPIENKNLGNSDVSDEEGQNFKERTEAQEGDHEMGRLAKKVLRKIAKELQSSFNMERTYAQKVALNLEARCRDYLENSKKITDLEQLMGQYKISIVDLIKKIQNKQVDWESVMTKYEQVAEPSIKIKSDEREQETGESRNPKQEPENSNQSIRSNLNKPAKSRQRIRVEIQSKNPSELL